MNATGATLYLHITAADLVTQMGTPKADDSGDVECGAAVRVEKLNSITLGLLQQWLQRTHSVTIRPVLDMTCTDAVDPHDPPGWMREAVILRDQHCVFPGCGIDARVCDQDHIDPYQPMDSGGPPGQTSLANLACLCRRHHRMKTSRIWHYQRLPDHSYQWTSPHGHTYTTHPGNQPGSQPGFQPGTRPDPTLTRGPASRGASQNITAHGLNAAFRQVVLSASSQVSSRSRVAAQLSSRVVDQLTE